MSVRTSLNMAFKLIGKVKLAGMLGVSYQGMGRWVEKGEMPCTEYNGKTFYSSHIERLTGGKVTVTDLLGFIPPPQAKATHAGDVTSPKAVTIGEVLADD